MDERQLAKVDPLLGLLHMSMLPRIAFVLGQLRAHGAIAPLLCVLIRWVRRHIRHLESSKLLSFILRYIIRSNIYVLYIIRVILTVGADVTVIN